MPRYSKDVKELGEKNRHSMMKHDTFHEWQKTHLKMKGRMGEYEKAYNYVKKGAGDVEADTGLRSTNEDENDTSL